MEVVFVLSIRERNFCLKRDVMAGYAVLQRCGSQHHESNYVSLSLTLAVDDWLQSTSFLSCGKRKAFISCFGLCFFNYKRQQKYHFSLNESIISPLEFVLSLVNTADVRLNNILK